MKKWIIPVVGFGVILMIGIIVAGLVFMSQPNIASTATNTPRPTNTPAQAVATSTVNASATPIVTNTPVPTVTMRPLITATPNTAAATVTQPIRLPVYAETAIRHTPQEGGAITGLIPAGGVVYVGGSQGEWSSVTFGTVSGWIKTSAFTAPVENTRTAPFRPLTEDQPTTVAPFNAEAVQGTPVPVVPTTAPTNGGLTPTSTPEYFG